MEYPQTRIVFYKGAFRIVGCIFNNLVLLTRITSRTVTASYIHESSTDWWVDKAEIGID